jgi:circadian clock protein KaiB
MMAAARIRPPAPKQAMWNLSLYVADLRPSSILAFENLKAACKEHLHGRYRIHVIDVLAHPEIARSAQIVAVPTVVRLSPKPIRTAIGDLSDGRRLLAWLNLEPQ